jgi:hypothetical protein
MTTETTPTPDLTIVPYDSYTKALLQVQDRVRAELVLAKWQPVLLIQPCTNITFVGAQVVRTDTQWKKGTRISTPKMQSALEDLESLFAATVSNETRTQTRQRWDEMCDAVAADDEHADKMRNPTYKHKTSIVLL